MIPNGVCNPQTMTSLIQRFFSTNRLLIRMFRRASALILALVLWCLARDANAMGRSLQQSIGNSVPMSATLADLVNDPQGRGHLLVRSPYHSC